jgi:GntR family transcriptional regulator
MPAIPGGQSPGVDALSPINRESPVPLHHQVRSYLLRQIEDGDLQPGRQLLQEREYAARFGISLAPVRQAILDLVKDGYLYRVRGRGTFVREHKVEEKISLLSSFTASMKAKGVQAELRITALRVVPTPDSVRKSLGRGVRQAVLLQRAATVNGEGAALLTAYLPADLVPGLTEMDLADRSLYATLEERYGIIPARAESWIEVVRCQPRVAEVLGIAGGTPLLQVEGITYDTERRAIEFSQVLYRADRFRFSIESFRRDDRVLNLIGSPAGTEVSTP